mmetsp:Transcript_53339/g.62281  ORF Transcript_53339/g.62281 Transcript_53339/m.62281 type:complete len:241 (+) Transcript_53339:934-1656(+)
MLYFVRDEYYQYQNMGGSIIAQQSFDSGHSNDDKNFRIRTSLSLHNFLQDNSLPQWYPLSNLETGPKEAKILNMLQMKKNSSGGLNWDNDLITSRADHKVALPMAPRKCYRIGVIGGGIAGLATASELLRLAETRDEQLDIEVVLFESRSRLGGRLHTDYDTFKTPSGDKFPVDLGAAWIHGINGNPLKDLAEECNNDLIQASENVKMLGADMKVVDEETDKKTDNIFDDILDKDVRSGN